MRQHNAFKIIGKRLEYTKKIQQAVLDPNVTIGKLVIDGGYDWIDNKYGFIKLLISRGQILEIDTNSDLISRDDYLYAIGIGVEKSYSFKVNFIVGTGKACASQKRIDMAREKWIQFVNNRNEA
jgi:hypothetical protein